MKGGEEELVEDDTDKGGIGLAGGGVDVAGRGESRGRWVVGWGRGADDIGWERFGEINPRFYLPCFYLYSFYPLLYPCR